MKMKTLGFLAAALFLSPNVNAVSVDLGTWTAETFLNQPGQSSWNVQNAPTNDQVLQTVNGQPTVFYDPNVNAQGTALSGRIRVTAAGNSDDDFIGFVLGYNAGEITSAGVAGDGFFLVDWKQGNQGNPFGGGCSDTGEAGLAISRVTSINAAGSADFWGHCGGLTEIAEASSLGNTGWADDTEYLFNIIFTSSLIQVSVDGALELSITPAEAGLASFADGGFGFYNFSQAQVLYSTITQVDCEQNPDAPECQGGGNVPVPGSLALFGLGLTGLALLRRRKSN